MSFSENLDALISRLHLTQEEIARAAGVTPGAVTGWRNGSLPRRGAIKRLCDAYGLTEDDLLSASSGLASREHAPRVGAEQVVVPLVAGVDPQRESRRATHFVTVPAHVAQGRPNLFAVQVKDDGMSMSIPVGSHAIIDPEDLCPENGSPVAFKILDLQAITTLWTSGHRIQFRRWYVGVTHLMLSPLSYNDKFEDLVMRLEDADSTIDLLGAVVWFQSAALPLS